MDSQREGGACEVTITAPNREWLQGFVHQLIENRMAAAGHVDTMSTTYRWADNIHEAEEARAVLHTHFDRVDAITSFTRVAHPYEVACVVATPIRAGDSNYLEWIAEMTQEESLSD